MTLDFTTSFIKLNNQYTIVGSAEGVDPTTKPKKGELYFMPEENGERTCKIGDGETEFQHLPTIGVSSLGLESTPDIADITLDYNSNYKLSVGNKDIVFKMPSSDSTEHTHDTSNITALTNYSKPDTTSALAATDTLNTALGKLEKALDGKSNTHTHPYLADTTKYAGSASAGGPATKVERSLANTAAFRHVWFSNYSDAEQCAYNDQLQFQPGNGSTHTCLKVANTGSGSVQLDLHRAGATGYIVNNGGTDSNIGICAGQSATALDKSVVFTGASVYPGTTNVQSLGTSTYKWSNVYATLVNGYTLAAACAKTVTDSAAAGALSSTGTSLVTERDVYYGLPYINNSHAYTSSTKIYAPTSAGTAGYILKSNGGTNAPTWLQTLPIANGGTGTTTAAGLTSKVLTGGFTTAAIKATTVTIAISVSSLSTSVYESFSTTIKGIILGTTSAPTDSAGVLAFNGVTIENQTTGNCKITVKAKKGTGTLYDPSTTISIPVLSIPMS